MQNERKKRSREVKRGESTPPVRSFLQRVDSPASRTVDHVDDGPTDAPTPPRETGVSLLGDLGVIEEVGDDPDRGVVFRFDKPRFGKTHRLCSHELGWLAVQNAAHIRGRISNTGGGRRRPAHAPPPLAASESRYKAPSRGSRAAVCSCQAGHRRGRSRHSPYMSTGGACDLPRSAENRGSQNGNTSPVNYC